ncbi:hypothetical protein BSKO_02730 [Bryopsis sp. KO-2023]|nr:hypothetical protein BSKO_02730 [Bryopsis sp. KO-2023]
MNEPTGSPEGVVRQVFEPAKLGTFRRAHQIAPESRARVENSHRGPFRLLKVEGCACAIFTFEKLSYLQIQICTTVCFVLQLGNSAETQRESGE